VNLLMGKELARVIFGVVAIAWVMFHVNRTL